MKAVIWPYQYKDMRELWRRQMVWVIEALECAHVDVKIHPEFICRGMERRPRYDYRQDNPCDIAVYNHTDASLIDERCLKARANWFFKPTVPDEVHTTLDPLGYGPYSSIFYKRPPYLSLDMIEADRFFDTEVAGWVESRVCKWGAALRAGTGPLDVQDYILVLGQCAGDTVVTKMDCGAYVTKLQQVVTELVRVDPRPVVVKLHPYMNGHKNEHPEFANQTKATLEAIDPRVKVITGRCSVHPLLRDCRAVVLANSGAGFEAMMHHKPIIAWGAPEYHWVAYDLRHLCDLKRALRLNWFNRTGQDKFLCWYMKHYCFWDGESAYRRVRELLATVRAGDMMADKSGLVPARELVFTQKG